MHVTLRFKLLLRFIKPTLVLWFLRGCKSPSPQCIKLSVLKRYKQNEGIWIETGTYLGDTTKKLSKIGLEVVSIEPDNRLFEFSLNRLKRFSNVNIKHGTSETLFSGICSSITSKANFWLDGHFSGDVTYLGETVSPIRFELKCISKILEKGIRVSVFIDDFRLFVDRSEQGYPAPSEIVEWAKTNNLGWTVEHDIFIASSLL